MKEVEAKTKLPFEDWIKKSEDHSTLELMEEVLIRTKYIEWLNDGTDENRQRIENIEELKSVASLFVDLNEFLENVALIESADKPNSDSVNAITLMTVHASKGLEFSIVFIIGMEEGLFPHTQSMAELDDLEEERRLCYVAITRAMTKVFLTHTNSRLYFGNVQSNLPSRFLDEIPQELLLRLGNTRGGRSRNYGNFSAQDVNDYLDDMDNKRNFSWD